MSEEKKTRKIKAKEEEIPGQARNDIEEEIATEPEAPRNDDETLKQTQDDNSQVQGDTHEAHAEIDFEFLYKKCLADQENARKRLETEKMNLLKYANMNLIGDLLPVIDNYYRAVEHVPADQANSPWITGITYIQKQLLDVLDQYGVKELVVKEGDAFDSSKHEATGTVLNDQFADDAIVTIQNRGYMMHDRLLRPATVIVNKLDKLDK